MGPGGSWRCPEKEQDRDSRSRVLFVEPHEPVVVVGLAGVLSAVSQHAHGCGGGTETAAVSHMPGAERRVDDQQSEESCSHR